LIIIKQKHPTVIGKDTFAFKGSWHPFLDKIVREGAQKMLITALQCEVDEYLAKFEGEKDARIIDLSHVMGKPKNAQY